MKGFKEFIVTEGVIKLPPRLESDVEEFIWKSTLQMAYPWMNKLNSYLLQDDGYAKLKELGVTVTEKHLKDEIKAYTALAKKYGVKDTTKKQKKFTKTFTFDFKHMPAHYPKDKKNIKRKMKLTLITEKANRANSGKWRLSKDGNSGDMTIDLSNMLALTKYNPTVISQSLEAFKKDMKTALSTMEHELMHVVQGMLLVQVDIKQGSQQYLFKNSQNFLLDQGDAYFNSPNEFDPTIVSALDDLRRILDWKKTNPEFENDSVKHTIDVFVLSKKYSGKHSEYLVSPFFKALKKVDKNNWKRAIKKFYTLGKQRKII